MESTYVVGSSGASSTIVISIKQKAKKIGRKLSSIRKAIASAVRKVASTVGSILRPTETKVEYAIVATGAALAVAYSPWYLLGGIALAMFIGRTIQTRQIVATSEAIGIRLDERRVEMEKICKETAARIAVLKELQAKYAKDKS